MAIVLSGKFPGFAARFPAVAGKSAHFGQKVPILWTEIEKFAAKFADAGNSFNFSRLTNFSFRLVNQPPPRLASSW
jgi:hypothetical protein